MNITKQISGKKIIYKKDYLNAYFSGPKNGPELLEREKENNLVNLTSKLDFVSSYSSNCSRKEGPVKIGFIK